MKFLKVYKNVIGSALNAGSLSDEKGAMTNDYEKNYRRNEYPRRMVQTS
jgi:hypothetical protein